MKNNRKIFLFVYSILMIPFLLSVSGCKKKQPQQETPPRPVQTAKAIKKNVPIFIDTFGTLSSKHSVDIKSQVTGQIVNVLFEEGSVVSKNDVLFTIDKRPYQAVFEKAQAAVTAQEAQIKLLRDTLTRNTALEKKNLISKQDFEEIQTNLTAAEAQLAVNKADLKTAQLNLDYCDIHSPIDGITGKRLVDPGNIVIADNGPVLVNIKSSDTLYIDFTVTDQDLKKVREAMAANKLEILVTLNDEKNLTGNGTLEFIDNAVDTATGTIALRGSITNKDNLLWPGQFIDLRLILGTEENATLVPYDAVQIGKKGPYLFAVSAENKADLRTLVTGDREDNNIIIKKGVKPGETVVTVGQLGLSPGAAVQEITKNKSEK